MNPAGLCRHGPHGQAAASRVAGYMILYTFYQLLQAFASAKRPLFPSEAEKTRRPAKRKENIYRLLIE